MLYNTTNALNAHIPAPHRVCKQNKLQNKYLYIIFKRILHKHTTYTKLHSAHVTKQQQNATQNLQLQTHSAS